MELKLRDTGMALKLGILPHFSSDCDCDYYQDCSCSRQSVLLCREGFYILTYGYCYNSWTFPWLFLLISCETGTSIFPSGLLLLSLVSRCYAMNWIFSIRVFFVYWIYLSVWVRFKGTFLARYFCALSSFKILYLKSLILIRINSPSPDQQTAL